MTAPGSAAHRPRVRSGWVLSMALALGVRGLMNVQYVIMTEQSESTVYVLEVNPRASRTVPFIAKVTGVPVVRLAVNAALGKTLVSRSEAKRLVARLTDFRQVILDFSGVQVAGQGFCDEVFRVFAHAHPHVTLEPVGMSDTVAFMVNRARAAATS